MVCKRNGEKAMLLDLREREVESAKRLEKRAGACSSSLECLALSQINAKLLQGF